MSVGIKDRSIARGRSAALLLGVWTLVALLNATQWQLINDSYGAAKPWSAYFGPALTVSLIWAALTPAILWLGRRIPMNAARWRKGLALHLVAGSLLSVAHTLIYVLLLGVLFGGDEALTPGLQLLQRKLATSFQANFLIYAIVAAGAAGAEALRTLGAQELERAQLKGQIAETAAAALRQQVQPHFLFNALNAISALVRTQPVEAERMIARLGDLLRLSLNANRNPDASLSDELQLIDAYLAVEQMRLGSRLNVVRRIAPEVEAARLPTLLLQPLVENAIRHGIAPSPRPSTLTLTAALDGAYLDVQVADDGVGASDIRENIGLGHTRQRLAHLFPGRHAFDIETKKGNGFRVRLRVPQ